jgi:hypothetical protein
MSLHLRGFSLDKLPVDWDALKQAKSEGDVSKLFDTKAQIKELMNTEIYKTNNQRVPDERIASEANLPVQ